MAEITKEEREVLKEAANIIMREVSEGGKVIIRDFGIFQYKGRKARTARNPKTGESVDVPAKQVLTFKANKNTERLTLTAQQSCFSIITL